MAVAQQVSQNPVPVEIWLSIAEMIADQTVSEVVNKAVFSNKDIRLAAQSLYNLSWVCTTFKRGAAQRIVDIQTIFRLYNKYHFHNEIYLQPGCYYDPDSNIGKRVPCGNPQLVDLLASGYPSTSEKTFESFSPEQEEDLKQIVKLMPRSLLCNIGRLRCREFITPFIMACHNRQVPVTILQFLLLNGAKSNSVYKLSEKKIHILTDLKNCDPERFEQIKPVLVQFGALEQVFSERWEGVPLSIHYYVNGEEVISEQFF